MSERGKRVKRILGHNPNDPNKTDLKSVIHLNRFIGRGWVGQMRTYNHDGKVYRIRDLWEDPEMTQLITCQYAFATGDGYIWTDCREGSRFDEIKPVRG